MLFLAALLACYLLSVYLDRKNAPKKFAVRVKLRKRHKTKP